MPKCCGISNIVLTVRMHCLGALRTLDVDPSLLQLDFYVDLEAVHASQMGAISQEWKMLHRRRMETERALPNLRKDFSDMIFIRGEKGQSSFNRSHHFPIWSHDRGAGTKTATTPASGTRAGETAGAAVVLLDARAGAEVVPPHHRALLRHGIVRHRRRHRRGSPFKSRYVSFSFMHVSFGSVAKNPNIQPIFQRQKFVLYR